MKVQLTFKHGLKTVAVIEGPKKYKAEFWSVQELEDLITKVPTLIEKATGLRVHINEIPE